MNRRGKLWTACVAVGTLCSLALFASATLSHGQEVKVVGSEVTVEDVFGWSVAIDGPVAVVGAPGSNLGDDPHVGAVYVYAYSGCAWVEVARLTASDGAIQDQFGMAVAISGETIVVGVPYHNGVGYDSGAVYLYEVEVGGWAELIKLTASDADAVDIFGWDVAIDGDWMAVSAPSDDDAGFAAGAVYVFQRQGEEWQESAKLLASDAAPSDRFGVRVALQGEVLVVSATGDDDLGDGSGSAYIFRRIGGIWMEEAKLTASDGAEMNLFGKSVALDGDLVAIGADGHSGAGLWSGAAYLFRHTGDAWVEEAQILADDAAFMEIFGWSIGAHNGRVVVGAKLGRTAGGLPTGSAHLFEMEGGAWSQVLELNAFDAAIDDQYGFAVAIHGDVVVVGAPLKDDAILGEDAGAAYIYGIPFHCFLRGDGNADGAVDISDAVHILSALFVPGSPESPCEDAADANDDGLVNVADPVMLLSFLFVPQTPPLPAPFPACEGDPTPGDPIGCDSYGVCP